MSTNFQISTPPSSGIFYTLLSLFTGGNSPDPPPVTVCLPRISVSSQCKLYGTASRVTLVQTFVNPSSDAIPTAAYKFPLYESCAVVAFRCTVGGSVFEGIIQDRNAAQAQYEAAVAHGKTAGLLEQCTPDIFSAALGNIPARATVTVEIEYIMELMHDTQVNGLRFTIPVSIAPTLDVQSRLAAEQPTTSKCEGIGITIEVTMPSNIRSIQSPSHSISLHLGTHSERISDDTSFDPKCAFVSLIQKSTELNSDFVLLVKCADLPNPQALLEKHLTLPKSMALMVTLVPVFNPPQDRLPEIVFLVDRGPEMGESMKTVGAILASFLQLLPMDLRFNICSYGPRPSFLWEESRPVTLKSLEFARHSVANMQADFPSAAILPSIQAIATKRPHGSTLEIILVTKGLFHHVEDVFQCVRDLTSNGDVRLFCLSVGPRSVHSYVEGIARAGRGYCQFITDEMQRMDEKVSRMLMAGLSVHVQDFRLDWEGRPIEDEIIQSIQAPSDVAPSRVPERKKINLFDPNADVNSPVILTDRDHAHSLRNEPFQPSILQAPHDLSPLFPFSRSTIYVIISEGIPTPLTVWIRGKTSSGDELELEIKVRPLWEKGTTIHQLAARKVLREMEDGTGFFCKRHSIADREGRTPAFHELIAREGARFGLTYRVASRWTSFVADRVTATKRNPTSKSDRFSLPVDPPYVVLTAEAGGSIKDGDPSVTTPNNLHLSISNSTVNIVNRDQHNYSTFVTTASSRMSRRDSIRDNERLPQRAYCQSQQFIASPASLPIQHPIDQGNQTAISYDFVPSVNSMRPREYSIEPFTMPNASSPVDDLSSGPFYRATWTLALPDTASMDQDPHSQTMSQSQTQPSTRAHLMTPVSVSYQQSSLGYVACANAPHPAMSEELRPQLSGTDFTPLSSFHGNYSVTSPSPAGDTPFELNSDSLSLSVLESLRYPLSDWGSQPEMLAHSSPGSSHGVAPPFEQRVVESMQDFSPALPHARIFLYRDVHGVILSGTIDGLVDELIAVITNDSTAMKSDCTEYSQVFLLTHCTFIPVEVLVETLWEKFQAAQVGDDTQQARRWDHRSFFFAFCAHHPGHQDHLSHEILACIPRSSVQY